MDNMMKMAALLWVGSVLLGAACSNNTGDANGSTDSPAFTAESTVGEVLATHRNDT